MPVTADLIDMLLYQGEGTALDFKRDQYPFDGASDTVKAKLLKDILAFANSWRDETAYILIGVQEVPGARGIVVGVNQHLADASLQQFVNTKIQRPLTFLYSGIEFEGKQIGVIEIPKQERPFYLKKRYASLDRKEVYIRRGSSTGCAELDEIAKMGNDVSRSRNDFPKLDVEWGNLQDRQRFGTAVGIYSTDLIVPNEADIPLYGVSPPQQGGMFSIQFPRTGTNTKYYAELVEYMKKRAFWGSGIGFVVQNTGIAVAYDVRVEIECPHGASAVEFCDSTALPTHPKKSSLNLDAFLPATIAPDVCVESIQDSWHIEVGLGKIQPGERIWSSDLLYFGGPKECTIELDAITFADNLPQPTHTSMTLEVKVNREELELKTILEK